MDRKQRPVVSPSVKTLSNSARPSEEAIPEISAVPLALPPEEQARRTPAPAAGDPSVIQFLRQFRMLIGASRLYQRNHPHLTEILASCERQLRQALAAEAPLILAVERRGLLLPRRDASESELLRDARGEMRALAEELLRAGICSLWFGTQTHTGELDQLARQISHLPRSATPGDTASRQGWDNWLRDQRIAGVRLNVPTDRRDTLLLASLASAVLAYSAPQPASPGRTAAPQTTFEQTAGLLRFLSGLMALDDPDGRNTPDDLARKVHKNLAEAEPGIRALAAQEISRVRPREGEGIETYVCRVADAVVLGFAKQEYKLQRMPISELRPLLNRLDQERGDGQRKSADLSNGVSQETRVATLYEKFWSVLDESEIAKILHSGAAWCVPTPVIARFLEPAPAAANKTPASASERGSRMILCAYARCLDSEEGKARRAVAVGLTELQPQIESLWPNPWAFEFGTGVVRALLRETSPGIAGLLSAVTENLARCALAKRGYAEYEAILDTLESAPRDDEHAHIAALLERVLDNEQYSALADQALCDEPLHPVVPRLLQKRPARLLDHLGTLLNSSDASGKLPAMVRLVQATGEAVIGALESRLYEPLRARIGVAIHLLAAADPKRLAGALPRALPSWEWSLQDLAITELSRWRNPEVTDAVAEAFLATVAEAHDLVVPCMIDYLGSANFAPAVPLLLQTAAGESTALRDIFFRIKAIEALGRMRAAESAELLRQIVRDRSGLAYTEPAALRAVAEEALGLLENRPSSMRVRSTESERSKTALSHSRPRRYLRVRLPEPLPVALNGTHKAAARVRTIALGGALVQAGKALAVGESVHMEFRAGLRRIESTAVVRNVLPDGAGVEFVHMKPEHREILRRFVSKHLR